VKERNVSHLIEVLKEADLDKRKEILSTLTKEEKELLYGKLYFERGTTLGISLYNGYASKCKWYERLLSPEYTLAYLCIKRFKCKRVLEIGCATGVFVKVLRRLGIESYGVDVSSYSISIAEEDAKSFLYNVDVETEDLPFPEDFFEGVIAIETMEHLANITFALSNIKRVLKIGGLLFMSVPRPRPEVLNDITHVNIWAKDKWIEILSKNGFRYVPVIIDYRELLKAHADLLTVIEACHSTKRNLLKVFYNLKVSKTLLYIYLLSRRRLHKALESAIQAHYVLLFNGVR